MDITMEAYHFLIIASIICFIIEVFVPSFVFASFGIGLIFSTFANYFEFSVEWQIYFFVLGLILSFIGVRPLLAKMDVSESTNSDRLIGMEALVTEPISENEPGRVKVEGDFFQAKSIDGSKIEKGEKVKIINYQSIILIVKPLK